MNKIILMFALIVICACDPVIPMTEKVEPYQPIPYSKLRERNRDIVAINKILRNADSEQICEIVIINNTIKELSYEDIKKLYKDNFNVLLTGHMYKFRKKSCIELEKEVDPK